VSKAQRLVLYREQSHISLHGYEKKFGTILDISKFTTQCLNTDYIVGQKSSCPQQDNEANKNKDHIE